MISGPLSYRVFRETGPRFVATSLALQFYSGELRNDSNYILEGVV